jgi:hypothetical protein
VVIIAQALKSNPDLLHDDSLGFFRDYLVSLGGIIPEKKKQYEVRKS